MLSTQEYASELVRLRVRCAEERREKEERKRERCGTQRESLFVNRRFSQSIYERNRQERVRRMKEQELRVVQEGRVRKAEM